MYSVSDALKFGEVELQAPECPNYELPRDPSISLKVSGDSFTYSKPVQLHWIHHSRKLFQGNTLALKPLQSYASRCVHVDTCLCSCVCDCIHVCDVCASTYLHGKQGGGFVCACVPQFSPSLIILKCSLAFSLSQYLSEVSPLPLSPLLSFQAMRQCLTQTLHTIHLNNWF